MRYNHPYHATTRGAKHRKLRITSFVVLGLIILIMLASLRTAINAHEFFGGFVSSLYRVVLAYLVCLVLGLGLGLATVSTPFVEGILLPIMDVAQSFPTFALLPILVFHFGHSDLSVVAILVVAMVWPIVFNVIAGVKEQRQDQAEAAAIFGAKGWKSFVYYRWPMLRPVVITGSIVSWGQAWDTIVGAEIIAGVMGAGHYLGILGSNGQGGLLVLGISLYLLLIFALNQIFWLPLLHYYTKYQAES